jgi:hypothetical protein
MERPDLVLRERADDRVEEASVVEEHKIPLAPVMRVYELSLPTLMCGVTAEM